MRIVCVLLFALLVSCGKQGAAEKEIVLINVGTLGKQGIAEIIDEINALEPRLMAIDFQFSADPDPQKDTLLVQALRKIRVLFMVSIIDDYDGGAHTHYDRFALGSLPMFLASAKTGFANTIFEENEMRTLSRFSTHAYVAGNIEYHFAVRVAMAFDSLRTLQYVEQHPRVVDVDYRNGERRFKTLSSSDILGKKISRQDIDGKIVMLGFMGPGNEDKFYTPLNRNPDQPDMYGLVYLAHIVVQIIESE